MTRWCPVCRKGWPDLWSVCGDCLAQLVDDPDATVVCRQCDKEWPARMQSCPNCLAELHLDPEAAAEAMGTVLAMGQRLPRPAGVAAFAGLHGAECTLLRVAPRSSLLYTNADELVEAYIDGRDHRAVVPLDCRDVDGTLLFRLDRYQAAEHAVVASDRDGTPLATFLRVGGLVTPGIDVRDETSAPVGHLRRDVDGWGFVETGGEAVAEILMTDVVLDDCVDDQWTLRPDGHHHLPLQPLAAVALLLAAKVLLGRASATPIRPPEDPDG